MPRRTRKKGTSAQMHNKIISQEDYRQTHETDLPPFGQYLVMEALRGGANEIPDKPAGKGKKGEKKW
jgi:hypothetical protein